jgi:flagellar M-ring protein FliF
MGFNQQRGDTLNVANANFSPPEKSAISDTPIWKDPETISLGKDALKYLVIALIAWLLWSKFIRPTLDRMAEANKPEPTMNEDGIMVIDGEPLPEDAQAAFERKRAEVREVAKQDPKLVASVVKEWMGGNEPR